MMRIFAAAGMATVAAFACAAGAAATVTTTESTRPVVVVIGDNAPDTIRIDCRLGMVKVNGSDPPQGPAACNLVAELHVFGGGGNDTLDLSHVGVDFEPDEGPSPYITADGEGGNDRLLAGETVDARGGPGADTLRGQGIFSALSGGSGPDRLIGSRGFDILDGGPGNDLAIGRAQPDLVFAGGGADRVLAGPGEDFVSGGPGRDRLRGARGADLLSGDAGPDVIRGGPGADKLFGGPGKDRLSGGPDADKVHQGGPVFDVSGGSGQVIFRPRIAAGRWRFLHRIEGKAPGALVLLQRRHRQAGLL